MNERSNTLPPEWKESAANTVRALSIARHMATRHATEETPESVLLPALLLNIAIARVGADICNRIEGVYDALVGLREPMLIERLAAIEGELSRLATVASAASDAGARGTCKGCNHAGK